MYLLTLILGIVLLHEASTLKCHECIPGLTGTCNETTKQCPAQENKCAAIRVGTYAGGSERFNVSVKSCASSEHCGNYSVNFGLSRIVVTSKCCTSDLCNSQTPPEPSKDNPNGRKCFSCDRQTCNRTLTCQGNEDHCFSGTVNQDGQEDTIKGCTATAACSDKQIALLTRVTVTKLSCCQGDLCNSASSTSAGLLLLVTPLISLILN